MMFLLFSIPLWGEVSMWRIPLHIVNCFYVDLHCTEHKGICALNGEAADARLAWSRAEFELSLSSG
jgi:hypothetical protein